MIGRRIINRIYDLPEMVDEGLIGLKLCDRKEEVIPLFVICRGGCEDRS